MSTGSIFYFTSGRQLPRDIPEGSAVPVIYCIGHSSRLYRLSCAKRPFGKYMVLNISAYSGGIPTRAITEAILAEYHKQSFKGLILLGPERPGELHMSLCSALSSYADIKCFYSEALSSCRNNSGTLLEISGISDNPDSVLNAARNKYGRRNTAVLLRRIRTVCAPPARSGRGKEITAGELSGIIKRFSPRINYSEELGLKYFNYRDESKINFILFDDAFTLKRKIALCMSKGIENIFFNYSEVSDIVSELEKLRSAEFR